MIRSMTGYGKGSAEAAGLRVTVELRSLNNRFADLKLRLPQELAAEEAAIRRMLSARIRRGRVELSLNLDRSAGSQTGIALDREVLAGLVAAAKTARNEFGIDGDLNLNTVFAVPEVFRRSGPAVDLDSLGQAAVRGAVEAALDALDAERRREGDELVREILPRIHRMLELVGQVRERAVDEPAKLRERLMERIATLAAGIAVDPGRVAQEAAFLADRSDVTEELVRLLGHLAQTKKLLDAPDGEPVGKRLDFLLQEIHRETNTVNSKSSDLEITRHALELKSEAEKIREQIQNLE